MRRRFSTRDLGLSIRMVFALAAVGAVYLGAIVGFAVLWVTAIVARDIRGILGMPLLIAAIPFGVWQLYRGAAGAVLAAVRAAPDPDADRLVAVAARLAAQADVVPPPDVVLAPSPTPNALAVPTQHIPLVIVTRGLLDRLDDGELEAVLAHEVSHLANRDGAVMAFVGGPAVFCARMWHDDDFRGKVGVVVFLWPLWLIGLTLMTAVSRYREFAADRGSALLTGAPEQLMSALTKIAGREPRGDLRGGAAVSALCIVGTNHRWFADHPPLEKRLARLAAMARDLGRPVGH